MSNLKEKEAEKMLREKLTEEISKRNNCQIECNKSFNTVWLHNESYETEFRYVIFLKKVIVSRICFNNRHQGCMTACFEILKKFAETLNYEIIEIQSVETYEMMKWCEKMNFVSKGYNIATRDDKGREVIIGDYDYQI